MQYVLRRRQRGCVDKLGRRSHFEGLHLDLLAHFIFLNLSRLLHLAVEVTFRTRVRTPPVHVLMLFLARRNCLRTR